MKNWSRFVLLALVSIAMLSGVVRAAEPKIGVALADRAKYDELLATKRGQVVLVDFWATWCGPCIKQFSHTVELFGEYDRKDLAVVSVSMDEPEDQAKVREFLTVKQAAFDNLLSSYGVGQEGFDAFDLGDEGVPHYKLYDRQGKLRHVVNNVEQVDALLKELVDEK